MLFDETTIRKLNQLDLIASKIRTGVMKGERRSTKRGTSIEFADFRNYVPGDDIRRLDWNVYARLDRPFIKLFEEEEDLAVYILVDISASMQWGENDLNKYAYALHLAGALGSIGLSSGNRVTIIPINEALIQAQFGPARGSHHQFQLLRYLEDLFLNHTKIDHGKTTDLNHSLRSFASHNHRPGIVFLLSDMFSPNGYESGFSDLSGRGYELVLLHILAPDEKDTSLAGDLRLVDSETGERLDVTLDGGIRKAYQQRISTWIGSIYQTCLRWNIRYLELVTSLSWDKAVLLEMRKAYIVK